MQHPWFITAGVAAGLVVMLGGLAARRVFDPIFLKNETQVRKAHRIQNVLLGAVWAVAIGVSIAFAMR